MSDNTAELSAATAKVTELTAKLEAAIKRAETAEDGLAQFKANIRTADVTAVFEKLDVKLSADDAKVYADMSDAAWDVVKKQLSAAKPGKTPLTDEAKKHLFNATDPNGDDAPKPVDLANIYNMRQKQAASL